MVHLDNGTLFSTKKKPQQWLSGVRRKRKTNRQNTEDLYGNETTLYDTIMVGTCAIILLPKPIECTTLYVVTVNVRVNLKVNYRLLVTVMCQCAFISGNVPLWWGMLRVGEAEHVRIKGIWELSAFSTQFYCGCKTAPKSCLFLNISSISK